MDTSDDEGQLNKEKKEHTRKRKDSGSRHKDDTQIKKLEKELVEQKRVF